jgi:adenosine deaminase
MQDLLTPTHEYSAEDYPNFPLAELHAHLGASISPTILWQIAHDQGIRLPKREYRDFAEYIRLSADRTMPLNEYFSTIYHPLLDPLSSGVHAVESATYHTMGGAYRSNGITLIELRNNPMRHNLNAQIDLDHITMAMLRGMERALLEYPKLSAGIIFCMAREFTHQQNAKIIEKAIKYRTRGVVGIDVAGAATPRFDLKEYKGLFDEARKAGLKITIHSGEQADANDMWEALEYAQPLRIGHGIKAAYDKDLMKELKRSKVVLEVCPMSNIATRAVKDTEEMKHILRTFVENEVPFCINTDWPEIIEGCHLREQMKWLRDDGILSEAELKNCNKTAFEASFIPKPGGLDAYL